MKANVETFSRVRARISILAGLAALAFFGAAPSHADTGDPVSIFMQARAAARNSLIDPSQLSAAMSNPDAYAGRTIEFTATVTGQVASGTDRTVLLQVGQSSISAALPESLKMANWFDVDHAVRVLFAVDPHAGQSMRLVAAAPDYDAQQAERHQEIEERAREVETSRSMPYSRDGQRDGSDSDETAGVPGDDGGHPAAALSPRARAVFGPYHAAIRKFNRRLSDDDVDTITNSVLYFSDANDVDPRLIVAMIIAESDFNIFSRSRTGAMGLGQLMPETARTMGVTDPYDPEQNIAASVRILRSYLDKYNGAPANAGKIPYDQIKLIMAAYNAGPGAVSKYHGVPPYRETQRYVERVAALYKEMCGD